MAGGTVVLPAEEQVHCWNPSGLVLEGSNSSQTGYVRTVTFGEKSPPNLVTTMKTDFLRVLFFFIQT